MFATPDLLKTLIFSKGMLIKHIILISTGMKTKKLRFQTLENWIKNQMKQQETIYNVHLGQNSSRSV